MDAADAFDHQPGSPAPLALFHRWCRCYVELTVMQSRLPQLVFADGPDFDEATYELWGLAGVTPSTVELLARLIPAQAAQTGASQVGVSVPFGDDAPGVLLVTVDETGAVAEQAGVRQVDDYLQLEEWLSAATDELPVVVWQELLASNAGYRRFGKWRCRDCGSVCPGEADVVPVPCDYCHGDNVAPVTLGTPLAPPQPHYDLPSSVASPFVQTLLGIIRGRPQG